MVPNGVRRLLIVGNGALAMSPNGGAYVNSHTGRLLVDLKDQGLRSTYAAPVTRYDANASLLDFDLHASGIATLGWRSRPAARLLPSAAKLVRGIGGASWVYIFFPGSLGNFAARTCRYLNRPYGLYVRGGKYAETTASRNVLSDAKFALTVSPSIHSDLKSYCACVGTIRPMVALDEGDRFVRPARQSPPATWRLLFVGRLEAEKGIRELIAAAEVLSRDGLSFTLRLVGGGPLYRDIGADLDAGRIRANVELAGLVSDPVALMREYEQANLFVFPTYHEGFPRVLYEAMIKSLPIITTMVGGIPGRMTDAENCVAIEARSSDAIVDGVRRAVGDLALLNRIAAAGLKTVTDVLVNLKPHTELLLERISRPH